MEIRKIRLNNVGRFTDLEVAFAPTEKHASKVTVFVGNNGAGKTTILKSLATALSWFVESLRTESGRGDLIDEELIHNSASAATITIEVASLDGKNSNWTLTRTRRGFKTIKRGDLEGARILADQIKDALTFSNRQLSLPLIAYYPVERSVLKVPLVVKKRRPVFQLDGYDKSLNQGVDFGRFFEWFRDREDVENEGAISGSTMEKLSKTLGKNNELWKEIQAVNALSQDSQLTAVRTAIATFMPGFTNLRVVRDPYLEMVIDKAGSSLNVLQLSQGEKSLMALVGDIARRLAIMNPLLENALHGKGVVLIDEVDLHLHPKWQRRLIQQLTDTFPNCQFILTTHSPLVISDTKDVLCYVLDDGELEERNGLYGLDANQVLLSVMDTDVRNSEVQARLDRLLDLLQDKKLTLAKSLFKELSAELQPGHIELAKAALLIRKLELRSA
ncbi:ATP-binding protein [Pseudomonas fluorescens]|nr:ATP-binding protein [Pseudomonas fluorescens]OPB13947.1 ATP-binding protein [Pseudomonas fluorescens]OPB27577.1 ATP-binding protein [Pseudomonas fluorescens]